MTALVILAYLIAFALLACIGLIAAYGLIVTWAAVLGLWDGWKERRALRRVMAALHEADATTPAAVARIRASKRERAL